MKPVAKQLAALAAIVLILATSVSAAALVSYDFKADLAATRSDANVTATAVTPSAEIKDGGRSGSTNACMHEPFLQLPI